MIKSSFDGETGDPLFFGKIFFMAIASTTSLVDALRQYRILEAAQLEEAKSLQARFPEPKALAGELIRLGWLTPYQANQLLQGRGQDLFLGSYILLERLGEGGMGQVFKAKNWKMGRLVALKLIRKERLDNPNAVRRFEREVRSAAALSHPNIVLALDADQVGSTHLLVMEYVEGTDLAKLVKKNGPLPVAQACEYVRQAALGLQHAYERGMVHRDIKPANLLLVAGGKMVKILDMGLARLDQPATDDDKSSTITQEGAVMGTPDYIAPEQALESHTVDIRGDLYSLGCTFYYLLTGKVPFPGGTLTEKLLKHQLHAPKPVELLRPNLPQTVAVIVRKMMAKKAEDRYQTPAEVAVALASLFSTGNGVSLAANVNDRTIADGAQGIAAPSGDSLDSALDYMAQRGDTEGVDSPHLLARKAEERRMLLSLVAGGSFVLVGLAVVLFLALKEPAAKKSVANEAERPVVGPPPAKAKVDEAWPKKVAAMPAEKQVEAVAKKLQELNPGFDGTVTHTVDGGVVASFGFITDNVTDISPVRALPRLRGLGCGGDRAGRKGKLADLSPLKDMQLTQLWCYNSRVADLSPLMGMRLTILSCWGTQVADLSPLKGMPLTTLSCEHTTVSDLSVLKDTPLRQLSCDFKLFRDADILRSIKTLEMINGKPVKEFWKDVEAQQAAFAAWCKQVAAMSAEKQVGAVATKLKELNPGFDGKLTPTIDGGVVTGLVFLTDNVTDISPLRALPELQRLTCHGTPGKGQLADLSPLKNMKLTHLGCYFTKVADLLPLKGMPLTTLECNGTQVADLSPLKDMKLTALFCPYTKVTDLSPLKGMPLKELSCDFKPERDAEILRSIKTLETINDKPAKEFWKEVDGKKP